MEDFDFSQHMQEAQREYLNFIDDGQQSLRSIPIASNMGSGDRYGPRPRLPNVDRPGVPNRCPDLRQARGRAYYRNPDIEGNTVPIRSWQAPSTSTNYARGQVEQQEWGATRTYCRRTDTTNWSQSSRNNETDAWRTNDGNRNRPNNWERDRGDRRRAQLWESNPPQDLLPEWAVENTEQSSDSSGAFHNYSIDDMNIPETEESAFPLAKSNNYGSFTRSKTVEEGSREWWSSEKAKKLAPKRFDATDIKFNKPSTSGEGSNTSVDKAAEELAESERQSEAAALPISEKSPLSVQDIDKAQEEIALRLYHFMKATALRMQKHQNLVATESSQQPVNPPASTSVQQPTLNEPKSTRTITPEEQIVDGFFGLSLHKTYYDLPKAVQEESLTSSMGVSRLSKSLQISSNALERTDLSATRSLSSVTPPLNHPDFPQKDVQGTAIKPMLGFPPEMMLQSVTQPMMQPGMHNPNMMTLTGMTSNMQPNIPPPNIVANVPPPNMHPFQQNMNTAGFMMSSTNFINQNTPTIAAQEVQVGNQFGVNMMQMQGMQQGFPRSTFNNSMFPSTMYPPITTTTFTTSIFTTSVFTPSMYTTTTKPHEMAHRLNQHKLLNNSGTSNMLSGALATNEQQQQQLRIGEPMVRRAPWSIGPKSSIFNPEQQGLSPAEIQRSDREKKKAQMKEQLQMMHVIAMQQAAAMAREQEMQASFGWAEKFPAPPIISPGPSGLTSGSAYKLPLEEHVAPVQPPNLAPWTSTQQEARYYTLFEFGDTQEKSKDKSKEKRINKATTKSVEPTKSKKKLAQGPLARADTLMTADFENWCTNALSAWCTIIDVPTFYGFIKDIKSPFEVKEYVKRHLGDTKESNDFSRNFLKRRSKSLRASMAAPSDEAQVCKPAVAVNPRSVSNSDYQKPKGEIKNPKRRCKKSIHPSLASESLPPKIALMWVI